MDLNSTNGTFLNHSKIEPQKYYQLLENDSITFGLSDVKYIVMEDKSVQYKREMFLRPDEAEN